MSANNYTQATSVGKQATNRVILDAGNIFITGSGMTRIGGNIEQNIGDVGVSQSIYQDTKIEDISDQSGTWEDTLIRMVIMVVIVLVSLVIMYRLFF